MLSHAFNFCAHAMPFRDRSTELLEHDRELGARLRVGGHVTIETTYGVGWSKMRKEEEEKEGGGEEESKSRNDERLCRVKHTA